jgi:hypothetical protein
VANLLSDEQKRSVRFLKEFAQNSLQERYGVVGEELNRCAVVTSGRCSSDKRDVCLCCLRLSG